MTSSDLNTSEDMRGPSREPESSQSTPIVSIVGHSGSGKTTLLERLIPALKARGYRLAVIKHHHHHGLRFDEPGKDSWRFARAGADQVVLAGPDRAIHLRTFTEEPPLAQITSSIQGVDLILTEGYKHASTPKIEVSRGRAAPTLVSDPGNLVAVAADRPLDLDVPEFALDDVDRLADFIEGHFLASR